jgi:ATP synthase protein I
MVGDVRDAHEPGSAHLTPKLPEKSPERDNGRDDWRDEYDAPPEEITPITRAEAERLFGPDVSRPSRVTPLRVVGAQIGLTLCLMVVCAVLSEHRVSAAVSALIGGAICWVPSAWFAMRLKARKRDSVGAWMVAEGVKLGITIAMFIAVAVYDKDVRWLPLLVTYVLALKTYWVALAWK